MKRLLLLLLIVLPFCMATQSCSPADGPLVDETERPLPSPKPDNGEDDGDNNNNDIPMNREIIISIGDARYTATLEDNSTARAFAALLPMTVSMTEMNGNEMYYNLSKSLPTDTFRPGIIHTGDLLLWGANTVVLFYETFSSSYSYTRLGRIEDPAGLADVLGRGDVRVARFSLNK